MLSPCIHPAYIINCTCSPSDISFSQVDCFTDFYTNCRVFLPWDEILWQTHGFALVCNIPGFTIPVYSLTVVFCFCSFQHHYVIKHLFIFPEIKSAMKVSALQKAVLCLAFAVIPIVQRGGEASLQNADMMTIYKQKSACYFFFKKKKKGATAVKVTAWTKVFPWCFSAMWCLRQKLIITQFPLRSVGAQRRSTHPLSLLFVPLCSVP